MILKKLYGQDVKIKKEQIVGAENDFKYVIDRGGANAYKKIIEFTNNASPYALSAYFMIAIGEIYDSGLIFLKINGRTSTKVFKSNVFTLYTGTKIGYVLNGTMMEVWISLPQYGREIIITELGRLLTGTVVLNVGDLATTFTEPTGIIYLT